MDPTSTLASWIPDTASLPPVSLTYDAPSNTLVASLSSPLANGETYSFGVNTSATSLAGIPLASPRVFNFSTTPHPSLLSSVPAANAHDVPLNAPIVLTFSSPMEPGPTQAAVSLSPSPGALSSSWSSSNTVLTLSHSTLLSSNTQYNLTIDSSAKSSSTGASFSSPVSIIFTSVDAPRVVSFYPPNGQTGVSPSETIVVRFSQSMDPQTSAAAFSLARSSPPAANVTGSVSWAQSNTFLTFTPTQLLDTGASYTATVAPTASSLTGVPVYLPSSSQFTVAAPPYIVSTAPTNNSASISIFAPITLVFSRSMAPDLTTSAFSLSPPTDIDCHMADANTRLTCVPSAGFESSTQYVATVARSATSLAGDPLVGPNSLLFSTEGAPSVAAVSPPDQATSISVLSPVSITFTTPMDVKATEAAFSLSPPVPGSFSWANGKTQLTYSLDPKAQLGSLATYDVSVGPGARSDAGSPLQNAPFRSSFTTELVPQLNDSTPADRAYDLDYNVPLVIDVVFNVPMDQASVASATTVDIFSKTGAPSGTLTGSYSWPSLSLAETSHATWTSDAPISNSTSYRFSIATSAKDANSVPLATPINILVSTVGIPTVVTTTPRDGAMGTDPNQDFVVEFSEVMDKASVVSHLHLYPNGNTSAPVPLKPLQWSLGDLRVTVSPQSPLDQGSSYTLVIDQAAVSTAGSWLQSSVSTTFSTWITPTIDYLFPVSSSPDDAYPRDVSFEMRFSEAMDPDSVIGTGVVSTSHPGLFAPGNVSSVTWSQGGSYVSVVFEDALDSDTKYAFEANAALVKSSSGAPLAASRSWSFDTLTTPVVTSVSPKPGDASVGLFPTISLSFSVAMVPETVFAAFSVRQRSGSGPPGPPIPGYAHFSSLEDKDLAWQPDKDLIPGTTYQVTLAPSATSVQGATLLTQVSWSFTVTGVPRVLSVTPTPGATNVWASSSIVLDFSRSMDHTTTEYALAILPRIPDATLIWSQDSTVLTVEPPPGLGLALDARYEIALGTSAQGTNGLNVSSVFTSSFVTSRLDPYARCSGGTGLTCGECQFISPSCAYNATSRVCSLSLTRAVCPLPPAQCFDKYVVHTAIGYGVGSALVVLTLLAFVGFALLGMDRSIEVVVVAATLGALALLISAFAVGQMWSKEQSFPGGISVLAVASLYKGKTVVSSPDAVGSSGCVSRSVSWSDLNSDYHHGSIAATVGSALGGLLALSGLALFVVVKREADGYFSFKSDAGLSLRKRWTPRVFILAGLVLCTGYAIWLGLALDNGSVAISLILAMTSGVLLFLSGFALAWIWRPSQSGYIEMGDALLDLDPRVQYHR